MPVTIGSVEKHSKADRAGLTAGDEILTVNCHAINDVLDYRFYTMDSRLEIKYLRCGKEKTVKIRKQEYEELGLDFETYLMDEQKSCKNKCIFCFIDQLPKGMRDTLYFKDDDSRLSFLFGNYITMTNLTDADVQRILDMHISPVNISVHTTNPELRCKMMNNRFAGDCLKYL
ncbi:MAG: PDZ domain-containing protein, partial [Acutalibacteraceae bacterium]